MAGPTVQNKADTAVFQAVLNGNVSHYHNVYSHGNYFARPMMNVASLLLFSPSAEFFHGVF
ncbi:MAG: hypothetical protein ACYSTL_07605 [Planctomycetota bacterium]|jgi:hypothetical protein